MKKLTFVVALTVVLGGCSTISNTGSQDRIKEIQKYTVLACKFLPAASTIVNILSSGASAPAFAIAADICQAVTNAPLADGPGRHKPILHVNGRQVQIHGTFVR